MRSAITILLGVAIAATPTSQPSESTKLAYSAATLAAIRQDIQTIEAQLEELRQLRQTVEVMAPLLADRCKAAVGDLNGDGKRDTKDLSIVYLCQGVPASQPTSPAWFADMDHDGDVDAQDTAAVNVLIKR